MNINTNQNLPLLSKLIHESIDNKCYSQLLMVLVLMLLVLSTHGLSS